MSGYCSESERICTGLAGENVTGGRVRAVLLFIQRFLFPEWIREELFVSREMALDLRDLVLPRWIDSARRCGSILHASE